MFCSTKFNFPSGTKACWMWFNFSLWKLFKWYMETMVQYCYIRFKDFFFFLGPKAPCTSQEFIIKIFYLYPFRSVGKTQMNEQSSRSHFVFTLRIFGINEVQSFSTVQFSFFCFVDVVLLKLIFLNFHSCVLEHWTTSTRSSESYWSCWEWAPF